MVNETALLGQKFTITQRQARGWTHTVIDSIQAAVKARIDCTYSAMDAVQVYRSKVWKPMKYALPQVKSAARFLNRNLHV